MTAVNLLRSWCDHCGVRRVWNHETGLCGVCDPETRQKAARARRWIKERRQREKAEAAAAAELAEVERQEVER